MKPEAPKKPRASPPCFAFWDEGDHVLVSGCARPKSALMVLRCASAMLRTLIERAGVASDLTPGMYAESLALRFLRAKAKPRFLQGTADRAPDAIVELLKRGEFARLAKLLTHDEHTNLTAVAVLMTKTLNRPGSPAVFIDARECAQMLGVLVGEGVSEEEPIQWTDPFSEGEEKL